MPDTAEKLEKLEERVDKIEYNLHGNGTPGAYERLRNVESFQQTQKKIAWIFISSAVAQTTAVIITLIITRG